MAPFFVYADNIRKRYDTLAFETEDFEFKQVLAIISFRKSTVVGYYASRVPKIVKEYLDTILVCADMEHVHTNADFKFMPYPYYRLKTEGMFILIYFLYIILI